MKLKPLLLASLALQTGKLLASGDNLFQETQKQSLTQISEPLQIRHPQDIFHIHANS